MLDSARLFIGLELNDEARRSLARAARALAQAAQGRLSGEALYHMTLCFLGDTPRPAIARVSALMDGAGAAFSLTLSELGSFQGGRVVWAGVREPCEPLYRLQRTLSERLRAAGFPVEAGAFHPHITLGRQMRVSGPLPALDQATFPVDHVTLFESAREDGRLAYRPLYRASL